MVIRPSRDTLGLNLQDRFRHLVSELGLLTFPLFCLALPGLPRVISALKSFDHKVKPFLELFLIGAIENRRDWEPDATAGVILVKAYSFT